MHIRSSFKNAACIIVLLIASSFEAFTQHPPYRIGKVFIERHNIFDSNDSFDQSFIASMANSLHFQTREDIIRNELLYAGGDTLNDRLLDETERNLRTLAFMGDIS